MCDLALLFISPANARADSSFLSGCTTLSIFSNQTSRKVPKISDDWNTGKQIWLSIQHLHNTCSKILNEWMLAWQYCLYGFTRLILSNRLELNERLNSTLYQSICGEWQQLDWENISWYPLTYCGVIGRCHSLQYLPEVRLILQNDSTEESQPHRHHHGVFLGVTESKDRLIISFSCNGYHIISSCRMNNLCKCHLGGFWLNSMRPFWEAVFSTWVDKWLKKSP